MSTVAYLGLGANLGDPIQQLVDARESLRRSSATVCLRCSSFYTSSPVGYEAQPDFINCVIELQTRYTSTELLDYMQSVENALGRQRVTGNQNAPRLIDIDLLIYGNQEINTARLTVPHPRMTRRLFVLRPLLELVEMSQYRLALDEGEESGGFEGQTLSRLIINS